MKFVLFGNFAAIYFPKTAIFAHFLEKSRMEYDQLLSHNLLIFKEVNNKNRL